VYQKISKAVKLANGARNMRDVFHSEVFIKDEVVSEDDVDDDEDEDASDEEDADLYSPPITYKSMGYSYFLPAVISIFYRESQSSNLSCICILYFPY